MKNSPRVFIIHRVMLSVKGVDGKIEWYSRHNYEAAKEYGRLVDVLSADDFKNDPEHFMAVLTEHLKDFNDNDSILCTGSPLGLIATGMVLTQLGNWTRVRILQWDKYTRKYKPFDIRAKAVQMHTDNWSQI